MSDIAAPARDFADPRVPNRDACVTRYLIDRWARERPDKVHIVYENGEAWTFAEVRTRVISVAVGLQKLGVRRGDRVAVWLPSGREATTVFYAVNYLGAVFVPFNTAYRGNLLAHVVANSEARVIVAHPDLAERLAEIDCAALEHLVLTGIGPAGAVSPANRSLHDAARSLKLAA
jgi:crotonobetaine/carnitine-CoA ligase